MLIEFNNISLEAYGVRYLKGLQSLLSYPKLKAIRTNDWAEENGLEVDTRTATKYESREVSLSFLVKGRQNYQGFITALMQKKTVDVYLDSIVSFSLLVNKITLEKAFNDFILFNVVFTDSEPESWILKDSFFDNMLESIKVAGNNGNIALIDSCDFSRLGVKDLEQDEYKAILEAGSNKQLSKKKISIINKDLEPLQTLKYNDCTLSFVVSGKNAIKHYFAFLRLLTRKAELNYVKNGSVLFNFMYKDVSDINIANNKGNTLITFKVNIVRTK